MKLITLIKYCLLEQLRREGGGGGGVFVKVLWWCSGGGGRDGARETERDTSLYGAAN